MENLMSRVNGVNMVDKITIEIQSRIAATEKQCP